jgi:macrolide transport system ATP-binding/permease protein
MNWRFWQAQQRNKEIDEEIAFDLAAEAEERYCAGLSREEAETASRREFGNVSRCKEDVREVWFQASIQVLLQDLRYGLRTLRANWLFSLMAILSLALGLGANTAIYSAMDAVMIRALPVKNTGELAILNWRAKSSQAPDVVQDLYGAVFKNKSGNVESSNLPWQIYELFRNRFDCFSTLFAHKNAGRLNLVVHEQAEVGEVEFVSGNFFNGLGVVPAMGRLLDESDNHPDSRQVAAISFDYWQERFNRDPAAIGQLIKINGIPYTIAGVVAPEFHGVSPGAVPLVYIPISNRAQFSDGQHKKMFSDPHSYWVEVMGRVKPGVSFAQVEAQLREPFHRFVLASANTEKAKLDLPALWVEEGGSGFDALRRQFSRPLSVLMAMVALILAITCANIANLLLSRAGARRREIAVRLSLGASRWRVTRQLLTESLMLAFTGCLLGFGVAAIGIHFLLWLLSRNSNEIALQAQVDWRILIFGLLIALTTGILFGLVPAIQATRVDVTPALKEVRASVPRKRGGILGLGQLLIVSQIALSLLLVLGAALFVRTLANLQSVARGFNTGHLLTFSVDAGQAGYKGTQLKTLQARLYERLSTLPGVRAASMSDLPLLAGWNSRVGLNISGIQPAGTSIISVSPTFFETMQLPIALGRSINALDVDGAPRVAVVNETFARKYFRNENPLGKKFGINSKTLDITIAGVAKDARYSSLKDEIPPVTYLSYQQNGPPSRTFFQLRTTNDPLKLAQSVRQTVHSIAPQVPVTEMLTQTQLIDRTISEELTFADLCSVFALLALVIAGVGVYGTMAYMVSQRTNEIGIRMAMGAGRGRIVVMVMSEVTALALAGLVIGLFMAWNAQSAIQSLLYGVRASDLQTAAWAIGILLAALLIAGYAPARAAVRIEPLVALRHE